jgi:hypothetical protein
MSNNDSNTLDQNSDDNANDIDQQIYETLDSDQNGKYNLKSVIFIKST